MKTIPNGSVLTLLLIAWLAAVPAAQGQLEVNLGGLMDENAQGYLAPLPSALSATLNSAVFRSGYVPLTGLTFSIGVEAMAIGFDDQDRTFLPTAPPYFATDAMTAVPTVIGSEQSVAVGGEAGTMLYYPGGFDLDYFGIAVPQLTIGAVFGTRAVVRYITADLGDADLGELELFGIGLQHSISQYFEQWPVDVAVGVFQQSMTIGDVLDLKALHLNATASRPYGVLEPYLGIGLDTFEMEADYTYKSGDVEEEITVDFERESHLHLTFGVGLNLPVVTLHAEYNLAAESGVALGLTFGM